MNRCLVILLVLTSCVDPQIGNHYSSPVRRCKLYAAGDPVVGLRDGTVLLTAKHDMYVDYIDVDNDGNLDKGDRVHINCDCQQSHEISGQ